MHKTLDSPGRRWTLAAAGLTLTWDDFAELSAVVPLLARVYPNGPADINHFHQAGGVPFVIGELLDAGLMHPGVETIAGYGLGRYRDEPYLDAAGELAWRPAPYGTRDPGVLRPVRDGYAEAISRPLNVGRTVIAVETDVVDARGRSVARVVQSQAVFR